MDKGLFALDNHFKKLADDHANAAHLGIVIALVIIL